MIQSARRVEPFFMDIGAERDFVTAGAELRYDTVRFIEQDQSCQRASIAGESRRIAKLLLFAGISWGGFGIGLGGANIDSVAALGPVHQVKGDQLAGFQGFVTLHDD